GRVAPALPCSPPLSPVLNILCIVGIKENHRFHGIPVVGRMIVTTGVDAERYRLHAQRAHERIPEAQLIQRYTVECSPLPNILPIPCREPFGAGHHCAYSL